MVCVPPSPRWHYFSARASAAENQYDVAQLRRYHIFVNLFIFAMLLAVSANNVGMMWVAIEATTIFSAMLIPLTLTKGLGRGLVEIHPDRLGGHRAGICRARCWPTSILSPCRGVLTMRSTGPCCWRPRPQLHPEVMRLAFVFLLIGYRDESRHRADAHVAARRPRRSALAACLP